MLIVSGIISVHLYPFAAATKARPMPVLPLVGSRIIVSGPSTPASSAASIMLRPMRSLTLPAGLKNSSLAATVATAPSAMRLIRTNGVLPISSVILFAIRISTLLLKWVCRLVCLVAERNIV